MKALVTAICAFGAAFGLAVSASAAGTYTWTATGDGIGSATYVKIADDVGALNGRLRLVGFSTAEGEYTVTSNRLHVVSSTGGKANGLPSEAYTYQMSAGARFDGTTTKSLRVQLAQPANSYSLYARITAVTTVSGDHMDSPDLREDFKSNSSTEAADLLANAVTKIVVGVANETIAYWPFGENGFSDVSGNGHDLVGVEISESDAAYISLNDGRTDQYLKTASALDLSKETAVTFECWCRLKSHSSGFANIVFAAENLSSENTGSFVIYNSGVYQAQFRVSAGDWQIDSSTQTDFLDGMWHHIAYVIDRSRTDRYSCGLYVDGVRQNDNNKQGNVPNLFNELLLIGGGGVYVPGKDHFSGYIDDVRISRGVVAPEDFLKCPTVGKKMRADDGKLPVVAYWPFGAQRGKDATGNGFDLAMSANVRIVSGAPSFTNNIDGWSGDFKCVNVPFSVFSKTGVTIEFFAKTGATDSRSENILTLSPTAQYYNNPGAFRFGPTGNSDSMGIAFRCKDSGKYMGSSTATASFGTLNDGIWRHYAAVYDPSKSGPGIVTLYVDGVAADVTATDASQGAVALPDTTLYFQRVNYNGAINSGYNGCFDDVRITAGVLTPDQFLSSRSQAKTIALYRLDKSTLADMTGNGHDLAYESGTPRLTAPSSFASAGVGLVLNEVGSQQRLYTSTPIDLSSSKAMTVEFDYNRWWGPAGPYALAASEDVTRAGGFVVDRTGSNDNYRGRFRAVADSSDYASALDANGHGANTAVDGCYRVRYSIDANASPMNFTLFVDGTTKTGTAAGTIDNLGCQKIYFGNSPSYYPNVYFKGVYYRIAISDGELAPADYVLDNLIEPETKRTLAYWDFRNHDGLTVVNGATRGGGLMLDGTTSVSTTNLTLSALTQVTVECFVRFGVTPSSGTVFSLGSGVGSFAVASDATAGTLTGTFIPYDHLAASNGGTANLAGVGDRSWHHVALVIDRTKSGADAVKFYVDYERATPAGRAWDKAATILDGVLSVGGGFAGRIDDLRVSAGALDPAEFLQPSQLTAVPIGMSISVR